MRLLRNVARGVRWSVDKLNALGSWIARIFVAALVALITVEVVSRAVFSWSTHLAEEVAAQLYLGIAFLGLAYALKSGIHVRVNKATNRLPERAREVILLITYAIALAYTVLLAIECWALVLNYHDLGTIEHVSRIPLWVPMALMPAGLILLALQLAVEGVEKTYYLIRGPKQIQT